MLLRRLARRPSATPQQLQSLASFALDAARPTFQGLEQLRPARLEEAGRPLQGASFFSLRKAAEPGAEGVQSSRPSTSQSTRDPQGEEQQEEEALRAAARDHPTPPPPPRDAAGAGAEGEADAAAAAAAPGGASEELAALQEEVEALKGDRLRLLADMENLRQRTNKSLDAAKQFALQGFAKDLLEVADNLERAMDSAEKEPEGAGGERSGPSGHSRESALELLRSFRAGVALTDKTLTQVFRRNGLAKFRPQPGDAFDPNFHTALFDLPDPSREAGQVAVCLKTGYTLNGRVIRSADVGTVRAA